ncbi:MAG: 1,2-phenylacetyl-CoA epoxidase subunit PaaC [Chitinophagales bacterium]|nr:phenylacetate-CoA oxygenase subunit PaaC [Bacteroidota bacterium]
MENKQLWYQYSLRLGDNSLIMGHRLSELCGHAPTLEEDIALTNIALDLVGQATMLLELAAGLSDQYTSADELAYLRIEKDYTHAMLVEQANTDFAHVMLKLYLFSTYSLQTWEQLQHCAFEPMQAIAQKAIKETKYHLRHAKEWIKRLGLGTDESNRRLQNAVDTLWRFSEDLFAQTPEDQQLVAQNAIPDAAKMYATWTNAVTQDLADVSIQIPNKNYMILGSRAGRHTEHLGFILAELQYLPRAYPNVSW